MSLQELLAELSYFAGLTAEELAALARTVRQRQLEAGEQIIVDGAFLLKAQAEKGQAGHDEH